MKESEPMRICLVGVSGFGSDHYRTLLDEHAAGRADIAGVTVTNPSEEAEKCAHLQSMGCPVFPTADQMFKALRGRADLCLLPVGIALHRPMTEAALHAGLHVIVEKPAAGAIQDVRAMQIAAEAADRIVAVAYQDFYSREILALKAALVGGRIGRIEHVTVRGLWPREESYYARNSWAGTANEDGTWVLDSPANNACAHELMMGLFLAGSELTTAAKPTHIEAEAYRAHAITNADSLCMRVTTSSHVPLFGVFTHACEEGGGAGLRIRGTHGSIEWTRNAAAIETADGACERITFPPSTELRANMIRAVRRAALGEKAFYCSLELAACQTLAINGAQEASPTHVIPSPFIEKTEQNGSMRVAIKEMDAACQAALQEHKLFSELGIPWAQPAGQLSLVDYKRFSGHADTYPRPKQADITPPVEPALA